MSGTKSVVVSLVSAGTGPSVSSMIPKALDAGPGAGAGAGAGCALVAPKFANTARTIKTMVRTFASFKLPMFTTLTKKLESV